MKHCLFILSAVFIFSNSLKSQGYYYAGIGYNMAFLHNEGMDFVVDRYNDTRAYLDEPMEYPRYYDGASIHFGGAAKAFMFDLGWTVRSCKVSAVGIDLSGTEQQRDLKSKWNTFDMGLGISLGGSHSFAMMFGVNTGIGNEKQYTRIDAPDDVHTADYEKINSNFKIGFEPFVQFILSSADGMGLLIKPYYSLTPLMSDYYALNEGLNPNTYLNDPLTIEGRLTGFGISFIIVAYGYDN